jgi:deoxycytidylate deaminase
MLINYRISNLIYLNSYRVDPIALEFLEKAGVIMEQYSSEE